MEIRFAPSDSKPKKSPRELLDVAQASQIKTFGWPIGVVAENAEYHPRPTNEGIMAEIPLQDPGSYDYWCLTRAGDFYLLKSLFEDRQDTNAILFNTRIVRVTETLLYCRGLYSRLGVTAGAVVNIGIRHGGLKGRTLRATSNYRFFPTGPSTEDEVETEVHVPLSEIDSRLVDLVRGFTEPIFEVFDFARFEDSLYASIVNSFVAGKVT
jgi:hypothetical protein